MKSLDKYFKITESGSSIKKEIIAGLTTFITMAYILVVAPDLLSNGGVDKEVLFTSTALAAFIGCFLMGAVARLPIALAPSLGLGVFFSATIISSMGYSFTFGLVAVFLSGLLFLLLSVFNVLNLIVNSIPQSQKVAISIGIGLLICVVGLKNAGIITYNPGSLLSLGEVTSPGIALGLFGILMAAILLSFNVNAAIFIAILATTIIGIPMGVTEIPSNFNPVSSELHLQNHFKGFEWSQVWSADMLIAVVIFTIIGIFDVLGTLLAVCSNAKLFDKKGNIPNQKKAFLANAISIMSGASLGVSTIGGFIESVAGVVSGGRTGLTAVVVGICFLISLLFAPTFLLIPSAATCCALVIIGFFMIKGIKEIDFDNTFEAIPAYITLILIPLSMSVADGIMIGLISFTLLNILNAQNRARITPTLYILSILFVLKFLFL